MWHYAIESFILQLSFILKTIPVIKKGFAVLLLFVLTLSMTPTLFLHDAFAGHKDEVEFCKAELKKGHCFHQQRINCHFNPLVVSVPYPEFTFAEAAMTAVLYPSFVEAIRPSLQLSPLLDKDNRGPPAAC